MRGVTRMGPGDASSVIFLHGGVINRHMWLPVMEELSEAYDCIAVDLPGHGALRDTSFTMDLARQRVLSVMDELALSRASMVGLSLGGYVALDAAAAQPARVDGLVISGATVVYTGWDAMSTRLFGLIFPLVARRAEKAFSEKLQADFDPRHTKEILETGLSMRGGGQALRRLPGVDFGARLRDIAMPIVIANGERDDPNRASEDHFIGMHPDAKVMMIEDAGHACAIQQPVAFAGAVRALMSEASLS